MNGGGICQKTRVWFSTLLICIVLSACISPFETRAHERLDKLNSVLSELPVISGSELLEKQENVVRSHVPRCATAEILQVFGTNDLTLQEVIEQYTSALDPNTWQLYRSDTTSASFRGNERINLGISDNYRWLPALNSTVQREEGKFKTFFLLSLNVFVDPDMTVEECT